jgi:hypothetical protein
LATAKAPVLLNAAPLFEARLTDTDGPVARIAARYEAYRMDTGARVWTGVTGFVPNGARVQLRMDPTKVANEVTYRVRVRAEDGHLASAWSAYCYFTTDLQAPYWNKVESPDYPEYDPSFEYGIYDGRWGWDKTFGQPGQAGTFRIYNRDAVEFRYWLSSERTWRVAPATGDNRMAVVTVTPTLPGMNTLNVAGVDAVGNVQQSPTTFRFRVGRIPGPGHEWRFDETAGAVAAASVGAKNLALHGEPGWDANGRLDGALRLGTDDSARSGSVIDTSKSFSVAAWVRVEDASDQGRMISQLNSSGYGFALSYAKNRWTFGRNSSGGARAVQGTTDVLPGYWTHVLAVYDASTRRQELYVNGLSQGLVTGVAGGVSSGNLVVGGPVAAGVDNLQIWSRVVAADEVVPLYDLRDAAQLPRGELLAHWKFEGDASTRGADSSGHDERLSFGPGVAWGEDPRRGGFLRLNATGGNGYAISESAMFDGTTSFTVTAWVRPSANASGAIAGKGGTAPPSFEQLPNLELTGERIPDAERFFWAFRHGSPTSANANRARPVDGGWQHVAAVWDNARRQVRIYVGGLWGPHGGLRSSWHSPEPLVLGKVLAGSSYKNPFVGDIDDVRVYAGALDQPAIQRVMAATD